jgi:hypothetical protein
VGEVSWGSTVDAYRLVPLETVAAAGDDWGKIKWMPTKHTTAALDSPLGASQNLSDQIGVILQSPDEKVGTQALRAQESGAVAVLLVGEADLLASSCGDDAQKVTIPVYIIGHVLGMEIVNAIKANPGTVRVGLQRLAARRNITNLLMQSTLATFNFSNVMSDGDVRLELQTIKGDPSAHNCSFCCKPANGTDFVELEGRRWHNNVDCLSCTTCGDDCSVNRFVHGNRMYCFQHEPTPTATRIMHEGGDSEVDLASKDAFTGSTHITTDFDQSIIRATEEERLKLPARLRTFWLETGEAAAVSSKTADG